MTEQRVSSRYAQALFDTARSEGLVDTVVNDFDKVIELLHKSKDLRALIESPIIQYWRKKKILKEVFDETVEPITLNFLLLLADKRRENLIQDIIEEYIKLYNQLNNRLPVEINSAVEIPDNLKDKLVNQLEDWTRKTVLPKFNINPSLKGGITVKIEDWVYDASIKSQLDQIYKQMAG